MSSGSKTSSLVRPPEPDISLWTPEQRESWERHKRAMAYYESLSSEEILQRFVKHGVLNPDGSPTKNFGG